MSLYTGTVLKQTRNRDSKGNRGYLSSRFRLLSNALVYARLMNEDVYPYKSFDKLADAIRIAFRGLSSSDFKPKGNYRPISISDLDLLLRAAAKQGIEYYNYAVLSLSTLIRYKDLKYISRDHLGSDGRLIYNKPVRGRYLSSKTVESGKIDPARLVNPTASLVSRIILRHLKFKAFDAKVEKALFSINSYFRASMSSHGKKYAVRRTLRTTGATMLSESSNSEECRKITRKETMERLAHVNEMMLLTIYGRSRPIDQGEESIDEYLDTFDLTVNGVRVNETEAAFDLWLLGHMIMTYKGKKDEQTLKQAMKREVKAVKGGWKKRAVEVG